MVYFAGKAIERVVKVTGLTPLNKGLGVFFGLLKMIYFVSVFIVIIETYDEKNDFFKKPDTKSEKWIPAYKPTTSAKRVKTSMIKPCLNPFHPAYITGTIIKTSIKFMVER